MIAKRVKRTGNSNFGHLARYIAGARDPGEKMDALWIVNTNAGAELEDLSHAIRDIEATQALNSRSKADKTYHLIVSLKRLHYNHLSSTISLDYRPKIAPFYEPNPSP